MLGSIGPLDARVLWISEAPERDDIRMGQSFSSAAGAKIKETLKWAHIDPAEVRFTYAVQSFTGPFPKGRACGVLLKEWAPLLDDEIAKLDCLEIIVLSGGQALRRITGLSPINDWRGSVLRNDDLPEVVVWGDIQHTVKLPPNLTIIPTLNPAGIMRSVSRDGMLLFRRDIEKVKLALDGNLHKPEVNLVLQPTIGNLERAAEGAEWCYLDTEYNPLTMQVFLTGVTFDGYTVFSMPWTPMYAKFLTNLMLRTDLIKGMHNCVADIRSLRAMKVRTVGPLWDTMLGYHTLHPSRELVYSLSCTSSFYLDDVKYWKNMAHDDPYYNALDVVYGAQCMLQQWKEAKLRAIPIDDELKSTMELIFVCEDMETQGMPVDMAERDRLLKVTYQEAEDLEQSIITTINPMWDKRMRGVLAELHALDTAILTYRERFKGTCQKHKTFNALRAPSKLCDTCKTLHLRAANFRKTYKKTLTKRLSFKHKAQRWGEGFKVTNSEHLLWLLYNPEALGLPIIRDIISRKPTSGVYAIDKLSRNGDIQANTPVIALIRSIKRAQSLRKAISTFILLKRYSKLTKQDISLIDANNVAHPRYKIHGTETGRLAGGKETHDERSDNAVAFNALNIPEKWRRIYVAPEGHILVAADWRNVEGRFTGHFSRDPVMNRALAEELTGGHKVHAINAGIIYNIDPIEVTTKMVPFKGELKSAYKAGKMMTHAWNYLMGRRKMQDTFGITSAAAKQIDENLSQAYAVLVEWRKTLIATVLGTWETGTLYQGNASKRKICTEAGTRYLANPYGWQKYWFGVEASQKRELIAFLPQSSGASIWKRCAVQLHQRYRLLTGTYDSFILIVPNNYNEIEKAAAYLKETMEQPWEELNGKSFPIEIEIGHNWGSYHEETNKGGLELWNGF